MHPEVQDKSNYIILKYANIKAEEDKVYSYMFKRGATYEREQVADAELMQKGPLRSSGNTTGINTRK